MVKLRSPREVSKEIDRLVDKGRKFLPLSMGGKDPNPQRAPKPRKPQPLPKTYQFTPTIPTIPAPTGDAVRWKPQPQETIDMTPIEALAEVVNNPEITIDNRLQNLINAATVGMDPITGEMGRIEELGMMDTRNRDAIDSRQFERQNLLPRKKRKVSKYSKRFGIELKKLKKLHPRTKVQNLMKKAHRATKRAMK
jgi:hypothetical protein